MKSNFELVREFHETFQVQQLAAPTFNQEDFKRFAEFRGALLLEELKEYLNAAQAVSDGNTSQMEDVIDGLVDILYVAYGALDLLGVNADDAFEEVHKSNMSKLDEDGEPIINIDDPTKPVGKILKGPKYEEPNLWPFAEEVLDNMVVPVVAREQT
jgi:predicted HAD superfamily Cof-like phosphohydrolase